MDEVDCVLSIDFRVSTYLYESQKSNRMANLWNKTLIQRPRDVEAPGCEFGASLSPYPPSSGTKV